jgi:hypothetical protein
MAPQNQEENQELACRRCRGSSALTVKDGPLTPLMKEAADLDLLVWDVH